MGENRNDYGRFTPEQPDSAIITAVRANEPAATSEVAADLDITRQGADRRLRRLEEQGNVASKKIGASLVWFIPPGAPPVRSREAHDATRPASTEGDSPSDTRNGSDGLSRPERGNGLESVEFPGNRDRAECEAAIYATRDYLKEHGPSIQRELVRAIMPNHHVGYNVTAALEKIDTGDRYRGSWWRHVVKPGLQALPDVEAPGKGASEWRYTGD